MQQSFIISDGGAGGRKGGERRKGEGEGEKRERRGEGEG